jgi:hypothetical protein
MLTLSICRLGETNVDGILEILRLNQGHQVTLGVLGRPSTTRNGPASGLRVIWTRYDARDIAS